MVCVPLLPKTKMRPRHDTTLTYRGLRSVWRSQIRSEMTRFLVGLGLVGGRFVCIPVLYFQLSHYFIVLLLLCSGFSYCSPYLFPPLCIPFSRKYVHLLHLC